MKVHLRLPCVLSIGGLDPGGGAGLLADARAAHAAGAFACGVAAVVTEQSTDGLVATHSVKAALVSSQARAVLRAQCVRAIKVGALGSLANVRAVAAIAAAHPDLPIVLDPVLLPSRGRGRLLAAGATHVLRTHLVPRARLLTANVPEAEALLGVRIASLADAHKAAVALVKLGAKAAIVKGGHLTGRDSVDVLVMSGEDAVELRSKRLTLGPMHGGGCTFASFIAARLALDCPLIDAVRWAKQAHHAALASAVDVGGGARVLVP